MNPLELKRNIFIYFLTKLYSFFSPPYFYGFAKHNKFNFGLAFIAAEVQGAIALLPRKRFARVASHPK